uniref:Putative secreted peptide n=1 Tax=Anopheles braziliensis TaxID=58242 RepID=A0A2M3ZMH2_9DIPT
MLLLLRIYYFLVTSFSCKANFVQQKPIMSLRYVEHALSTDSIVLLVGFFFQRLAIIFYDLKYGQCHGLTMPRALSLPFTHGANWRVFS